MKWEILIVPLIALGVWLLGTLFRNAEEEKQKSRNRRASGEGGARVPPRRPVTDLDRFLEEARRRREGGDNRQPAANPFEERGEAPRVESKPPAPRPAPAREQPREAAPRPRERTPARARKAPEQARTTAPALAQSATSLEKVPGALSRAVEAVPVKARAESSPAQPVDLPESMEPPAAPTSPPATIQRPRGKPSRNLTKMAALLRTPQAARTAYVMTEVFGPPLCKRRR
jgi:hypothetical protein